MMNQKPRIVCVSIISLVLVSCSGDNDDLVQYIDQVKQRTPRAIGAIPTFSPLPIFTFPDYPGRRSPFKPVSQKREIDPLAPDQHRAKQPLEAFPLDALKFVGTLKQEGQTWALIKQPDGQITRVRVDDYMGQNYGHILLIRSDLMQLEETTKSSGKWEKHRITLDLYTGK